MLNKRKTILISRILTVLTVFSLLSYFDFTVYATEEEGPYGFYADVRDGEVASDTNPAEEIPPLLPATSTNPQVPTVATSTNPQAPATATATEPQIQVPITATDTVPSETIFDNIVYPESITLSHSSVMITQGDKFPVTYAPFNEYFEACYSSGSSAVASVEPDSGMITANKPGKTTVSCTLANGVSADCTVVVLPSSINLKSTTINVNAKDKYQIDLTGNDSIYGMKYSSNNKNVATVSETGLVTTYVSGNAKIKCTLPNGVSATINIKVSVRGYYYKGIDVSEFQNKVDWEKVKKAGIDFVILRCGFGDDDKDQDDEYFLRNAKECERLGIPYGVYLYSYAESVKEAESEAKHTIRLLKGRKLTLPVYWDLEDRVVARCSDSEILKYAKVYVNAIEKAGYQAGIYANLNWWENRLTDSWYDTKSRWVAQYYKECQYAGDYDLWQYTSSGSVSGISGNIDMNYLYKRSFFITASATQAVVSTEKAVLKLSQSSKTAVNTGVSTNNVINGNQLQYVISSSKKGLDAVSCKTAVF